MRTCGRCERTLPDTCFYPTQRWRCRECCADVHRAWVANNRERSQEIGRLSAQRHREKKRATCRAYYVAHREEMIQAEKERYARSRASRLVTTAARYARNRDAAFAAYGDRCACCGVTERSFLQFDHVNNDGYEHRKTVSPGARFYVWLRENNYPDSIQILCANCNHSKRLNHGTCAHLFMAAVHGIDIREM